MFIVNRSSDFAGRRAATRTEGLTSSYNFRSSATAVSISTSNSASRISSRSEPLLRDLIFPLRRRHSCLLLHRRSTQNATAEALNLWQLRMRLINILLLGHEECALEYNNFDRARIPPFEFEEGSLAR